MTDRSHSNRINRETLDLWQQKKRDRMDEVIRMLAERGEAVRSRFIAEMCVENGFHDATIRRYLKNLEDYGLIRVAENRIFWIGEEGQGN